MLKTRLQFVAEADQGLSTVARALWQRFPPVQTSFSRAGLRSTVSAEIGLRWLIVSEIMTLNWRLLLMQSVSLKNILKYFAGEIWKSKRALPVVITWLAVTVKRLFGRFWCVMCRRRTDMLMGFPILVQRWTFAYFTQTSVVAAERVAIRHLLCRRRTLWTSLRKFPKGPSSNVDLA